MLLLLLTFSEFWFIVFKMWLSCLFGVWLSSSLCVCGQIVLGCNLIYTFLRVSPSEYNELTSEEMNIGLCC